MKKNVKVIGIISMIYLACIMMLVSAVSSLVPTSTVVGKAKETVKEPEIVSEAAIEVKTNTADKKKVTKAVYEPTVKEYKDMSHKEKGQEKVDYINLFDMLHDSITEIKAYDSKSANKFLGNDGKKLARSINYRTYKTLCEAEWENNTPKASKESGKDMLDIDISKNITYDEYVKLLKKMASYENVYLFKIGQTAKGKDLYAIEIDTSDSLNNDKDVLMLVGSVHSREQAGGMYILKDLCKMINSMTDKKSDAYKLLSNYRVAAVPILSIDVVFEMQATGDSKWYVGKNLWKSNADGIDLNRNYPSLSASLLRTGVDKSWTVFDNPTWGMYAGTLGEAPETQAMMKWIYWYVVHEQGTKMLTYHQQGRVIYAGQGCMSSKQLKENDKLRDKIMNLTGYKTIGMSSKLTAQEKRDRQDGTGDGLCGYATACALAKYDIETGMFVWIDKDGNKYSPLKYLNTDELKADNITPVCRNEKFVEITIETGDGQSYIGGSSSAYKNNKKEYENKHLEKLPYIMCE